MHGRDEDAGRVQLVAAQFDHQPATRAAPKPPADKLFDGRTLVDGLAVSAFDGHRSW